MTKTVSAVMKLMRALDSDADLHEDVTKAVEVFEAACAWQDALRAAVSPAGESAAIHAVRLLAAIDVARATKGARRYATEHVQ